MHFTIGDVVRDRSDMALGTVAGIAGHGSGKRLAIQVPEEDAPTVRLVDQHEVELVGRYVRPTSTALGVTSIVFLILMCLAAYLGAEAALEIGANWLIALLTALGSSSAVLTAYQWGVRLTGPRRIRI